MCRFIPNESNQGADNRLRLTAPARSPSHSSCLPFPSFLISHQSPFSHYMFSSSILKKWTHKLSGALLRWTAHLDRGPVAGRPGRRSGRPSLTDGNGHCLGGGGAARAAVRAVALCPSPSPRGSQLETPMSLRWSAHCVRGAAASQPGGRSGRPALAGGDGALPRGG